MNEYRSVPRSVTETGSPGSNNPVQVVMHRAPVALVQALSHFRELEVPSAATAGTPVPSKGCACESTLSLRVKLRFAVKLADTLSADAAVTVQGPVPEQPPPDHPVNSELS